MKTRQHAVPCVVWGTILASVLTFFSGHSSRLYAQGVTFMTNWYSVPAYPNDVIAADVNGDGKLDLVVAICNEYSWDGSMLKLLTNNGSGGFGFNATLYWDLYVYPSSVVAVDVNGDHKPDLVSVNSGDGPLTGTLTVLTNDGSGKFGYNGIINVYGSPWQVVAADVNGNGKPDLVCVELYSNTLAVLTNNGDGVFGSNAVLRVGKYPISLVAADLNADGKPDLICANQGDDTLTVLTNNGSGVFGSNATLKAGRYPSFLVTTDVNGDHKPDLVCANSGDGTLTVLTNDGSGHLGFSATLENLAWTAVHFVATDVNGDGQVDLITASYPQRVLTNNGQGGFGSNATLNLGIDPASITAADVNGDGKSDLIYADDYDNRVTVLINTTVFPPSYNKISGQLLSGGKVRLSFMGIAGADYALERSTGLDPPNWVPQATNAADSSGVVVFINTPDPATNNFWRVHSVP